MSHKNKGLYNRLTQFSSTTSNNRINRVTPKRVVMSKKLGNCSEKSCSTGIIVNEPSHNRPRKTTKSDVSFSSKQNKPLDFCSKCGDAKINGSSLPSTSDFNKTNNQKRSSTSNKDVFNNNKVNARNGIMKRNGNGKCVPLKQYYKNENFQSTDSIHETEIDFRKMSLDTIKELPENRASDNIRTMAEDFNVYEVYSDSEEMGFFDVNNGDNLDDIKKFREKNYFECHSAKTRVEEKGNISVTSLKNHKCVYRFYLNDRLFPIPLSTDHHDNVRCVECHLPMDLNMNSSEKANGTIQAKVRLGTEKDPQDLILFLPVKDSLIIKEKRRQLKEESDVVYFGVIKLDSFGNSVFKSTLPTDSLALKYQKGYREHGGSESYKYGSVEKDDVIII